MIDWPTRVTALTDRIRVKAWRIELTTPCLRATIPMLRGVWGRALRHLDAEAYRLIFVGDGPAHQRLPRYVLRPAPPDPRTAPAIDWILLSVTPALEALAWRAWDVACGMGLGPERTPFHLRDRFTLDAGGHPSKGREYEWDLSRAEWPLDGDPARTPCRVTFGSPLRLTRRGVLLDAPSLADITVAATRRITNLADVSDDECQRKLTMAARREADSIASGPWEGVRADLVRWSGTQQREIDLYGVTGGLDLPRGSRSLWPLLAACQWTHIGKGTVFGLGGLQISPMDPIKDASSTTP